MIINHNMNAMNAHRLMSANTANAGKSMEKLSSGLRINRAGDDAAGLAISEKMRGQIRGLDQASRNSQDGISMLQTAEGALNETHSILQRMRELATQAASDTNVAVDRKSIQTELNQLTSEINRIGNTTEFNTQKLLNGGTESVVVSKTTAGAAAGSASVVTANQASTAEQKGIYTVTLGGAAATAGNKITIGGIDFTAVAAGAVAANHEFDIGAVGAEGTSLFAAVQADATLSARFTVTDNTSGVLTFTEKVGQATGVPLTATVDAGATTVTPAQSTASIKEVRGSYSFNITSALGKDGTIAIGGQTFTAKQTGAVAALGQFNVGDSVTDQASSLVNAINANATLSAHYTATASNGKITLVEKAGQASGVALAAPVVTSPAVAGVSNFNVSSPVAAGGSYVIDGQEIKVTDDKNDAGIAAGTSMLVGTDKESQAANLISAINNNASLSTKYTASLGTTTNNIVLTQKGGQESATTPTVSTNAQAGANKFSAQLQIGANTAQSFTIDINDMRSVALKVSGTATGTAKALNGAEASYVLNANVSNGTDNKSIEFALDVSTHTKATDAISVINDAVETVSAERSKLGAFQNRLEHTIANLGTSSENLTASESRIRDVDMAKEMMAFSKNNILSQAAQAMLAQANQQPQGVLQLLR